MDGVPKLMDSSGQLDCRKHRSRRSDLMKERQVPLRHIHSAKQETTEETEDWERVQAGIGRGGRSSPKGDSAPRSSSAEESPFLLCSLRFLLFAAESLRLRGSLFPLLLWLCVLGRLPLFANDADSGFESANKLYEQGKFTEAVALYQGILQTGRVSAALYFNLGNALFKSGQVGRAILNFRLAQQLAPRDPDIRANLQFARNSVSAGGSRATDRWRRWIHRLTLNEWTAVTVAALWLWFGLLVAGQLRPGFKRSLRGYTAITGATVLLLGSGLGLAFQDRFHTLWAVVIAPETVVRYGPLEESQSHYKLRDGAEVVVTDRQNGWLEVVDSVGRKGWLRQDQVASVRESVDRQSVTGATTR